jgi:hypothetical protein
VALWRRVDEIIDRAPDPWAIRAHRLQLLALPRFAETGREVPGWLLQEQRSAALIALVTPIVLGRIRASWDGPMLVLKGPVVAARYPNEARAYNDLDILVPDAEGLHTALRESGFSTVPDPDYDALDIQYHLEPLAWEKFPLRVEIHSAPNWVPGLKPPPVAELFEHAVKDDSLTVDGVLTPAPVHHALLLAGHGWTHRPLGALRDLIDVAVMADGVPPSELESVADRWGMGTLWRATWGATEAVLHGRRAPVSVRLWARHLAAGRERTVLENHLERWLSPFWALPRRRALAKSARTLVEEIAPLENETWGMKWKRVAQAVPRALAPRSEHEWKLGELAPRGNNARFDVDASREPRNDSSPPSER